MNRIDRVTAILIQLQSKRIVRAQELADRFGISLRTVYRDIRTLEEAGVPIVGEAGVGYSIMEGYRLPPVMFTKEEAMTFLMAEKLVQNYTDSGSARSYASAMFKIRAVLRSAEQDLLENVEESIVVKRSANQSDDPREDESLQIILSGIHEKRVAAMLYLASYSEEVTERKVEPIGIFLQNNHWYLIAYCRSREDYRNFRIDRIQSIHLTNERFTTEHPSLAEYLAYMPERKDVTKVVIRIEREIAKYIVTEKYYHGFVSEVDLGERIEMTFLTANLYGFASWYMMLAAYSKIVEPSGLVEIVRGLLEKISSKLEISESLLT